MTAPKPAKYIKLPQLLTPEIAAALTFRHIVAVVAAYEVESELNSKRSPKDRIYTQHALSLLANPDHIADPSMRPAIIEILKKFLADNPPRTPTSEEIAAMVDYQMNHDGEEYMSLEHARRGVAKYTGKTLAAVKKAHARYGKRST